MPSRTKVLCAASTPSLGPYLVIRGPSSWALLAALMVFGYQYRPPSFLVRLTIRNGVDCVENCVAPAGKSLGDTILSLLQVLQRWGYFQSDSSAMLSMAAGLCVFTMVTTDG